MKTYLAKKKIKEFILSHFGPGHVLKLKCIYPPYKNMNYRYYYLIIQYMPKEDIIKAEYKAKHLTHLYELMMKDK